MGKRRASPSARSVINGRGVTCWAMAAALILFAVPGRVVAGDDLTGQASIIDGDTLEIHGTRIRLVWGFLCQGGVTPFCVVLCIPFFCSTRATSILPSRPHISIAVARSGGQGRRFFSAAEGLSLTNASTAAGLYGVFFVKVATPCPRSDDPA